MFGGMTMFTLWFYVPVAQVEQVKRALFDAGAGEVGRYDSCAWQTLGQGQFRPLKGAQPAVGAKGVVEVLPEYKVEMVLPKAKLKAVVRALRDTHPYEEPAFGVCEMCSLDECGIYE